MNKLKRSHISYSIPILPTIPKWPVYYIPNIPNAGRYLNPVAAENAYTRYQRTNNLAYKAPKPSQALLLKNRPVVLDGSLINQIASDYSTGNYTQKMLSEKYSMSQTQICLHLERYRKKLLERNAL